MRAAAVFLSFLAVTASAYEAEVQRDHPTFDYTPEMRAESRARLDLLLASADVGDAQKRAWSAMFDARFKDSAPERAGSATAGTKPAVPAPADAVDWVALDGGTFQMGSAGAGALPVHAVAVRPFHIARTPVTLGQYKACVKAGACRPLLEVCSRSEDSLPVTCATLQDAQDYSRWVGGRLPSEAEWEFAARSGGRAQAFPWGDEPATCERAVMNQDYEHCGCAKIAPWPVCSKPKGNTAQGLCDMAGNVFEWTADAYHPDYKGAPSDGSAWAGPASAGNVVRGGSWYAGAGAQAVLAAARDWRFATSRKDDVGFRPVRD